MRRDMVAWMWSLIAVMVRFILQYFYSEQFWVPLKILEIFRKWNLITNNYAMPFYNPHALTVASDRSLFREKLFFLSVFFLSKGNTTSLKTTSCPGSLLGLGRSLGHLNYFVLGEGWSKQTQPIWPISVFEISIHSLEMLKPSVSSVFATACIRT